MTSRPSAPQCQIVVSLCYLSVSAVCPRITCLPDHWSLPATLPRSPPTLHPAYPELVFPLCICLLLGYFILTWTFLQTEAIKTLRHHFNLNGAPYVDIFILSKTIYVGNSTPLQMNSLQNIHFIMLVSYSFIWVPSSVLLHFQSLSTKPCTS